MGHIAQQDKEQSKPQALCFSAGKEALFEGRKSGSISLLKHAIACFKATSTQAPFFELFLHYGITYLSLEKITGHYHFVLEAEKRFQKAYALLSEASGPGDKALLCWNLALCFHKIGAKSGEPYDLQKALKFFSEAADLVERLPSQFYIDFAQTNFYLGKKTSSETPYRRAALLLKTAISENPSSLVAWELLGTTLFELYRIHLSPEKITQANDCFAKAASLLCSDESEEAAHFYMRWAELLIEIKRDRVDENLLKLCIEKCQLAAAIKGATAEMLAVEADAYALLAVEQEDKQLLLNAKKKIEKAYKKADDSPEVCYAYGNILVASGNYFDELSDFFEAVEKYREGISLNNAKQLIWVALAKTFTQISQLEDGNPIVPLARARHCFEKAGDLGLSVSLLFENASLIGTYGITIDCQDLLRLSIEKFSSAFNYFNGSFCHLNPDWVATYAKVLYTAGQLCEEGSYFATAVDFYKKIFLIDPDYPNLHFDYACALCAFANQIDSNEVAIKALNHFRLAYLFDNENEEILYEWGVALINLAQDSQLETSAQELYLEAEYKLHEAARLGSGAALYQLSCLYALLGSQEKSIRYLIKADEYEALPELPDLLEDEWLDGIRDTPSFRKFIADLEKRTISSNLSE